MELVRQEVGIIPLHKFFHVVLQARQALGWRAQIHFGSEHSTDDVALLEGGDLGHGDDALVTLGCAHHGQADPSVAGRVLHHCHPRLQKTLLLGVSDQVQGNAVLDGATRILHLQLAQNADIVRFGLGRKYPLDPN